MQLDTCTWVNNLRIYKSLFTADGDQIRSYCDAESLDNITSSDSSMYFRFESDYSINGNGFRVYYIEVDSSCKLLYQTSYSIFMYNQTISFAICGHRTVHYMYR